MQTLHTESATANLAAGATILTYTPPVDKVADLLIEVGDGTNNIAATAATTLTVAITVGGIPLGGDDHDELVIIGRTRLRIPVDQFTAVAGEALAVTLKSDQAADTAVAVTATLRQPNPQPDIVKAYFENKVNSVDQGGGVTRITVRNETDAADVFSVDYTHATRNRKIVL